MKLVNEVFNRYKVKEDKLLTYGFSFIDDEYLYKKRMKNNDFELIVEIKNKKINSKLIDVNFNDEFKQIDMEVTGNFIGELKEECRNLLIDIRDKCFEKVMFIFPQSNRISNLVKEKYDIDPEFLFDSSPGFGVFRNKTNKKWFGMIMNLPKNKIIGDSKEEIEAINLKLANDNNEYELEEGTYPAYHMNKKYWASIILDDTLSDEKVMKLIDISYNLVNLK